MSSVCSPPGVVGRASPIPHTPGSHAGHDLYSTSPELARVPLPSAAPPALTSEQQLQHVQQTVAPPGKRQPAATYLGVPAEAGGTTPRDELGD